MCGIFGVICSNKNAYEPKLLQNTFRHLAIYSESRGKESCGFALKDYKNGEIKVLRGALPVSSALKEHCSKTFFNEYLHSDNNSNEPVVLIGHSRLVTNGSQSEDFNNQPVIKEGMVGIHNGIIVNAEQIWERYPSLKRNYDIDTEVFLALIRYHLNKKSALNEAMQAAVDEAQGTISSVLLFEDYSHVYLCTNNGSLYMVTDEKGILIFASEENILRRLVTNKKFCGILNEQNIKQVSPNSGFIIDPFNLTYKLEHRSKEASDIKPEKKISKIILLPEIKKDKIIDSLADINLIINSPKAESEKALLEHNYKAVARLKRCTKCILPETFPFIEFDEEGVCNYCRNYVRKNQTKPIENLKELIEPYKKNGKGQDCIIPFSGGRDSSFVMHYAKTELGLNPIAFTYDWGMVTDLARRNIARVCGKLGIENIIISANIPWKRNNIKKNIQAWLGNPNLGMIPLFMAGDKYFFYYTHVIKKQTGIKLNIWGINPLENTDFKVGFAGIAPKFNKERIYSLNYSNQLQLLSYTAGNFIKSPAYLNQSIFDTFGSYLVRYFYPKNDYYHLYDFIRWDEKLIEDTIINEYDWERAVDTKSTWRIGDGTASFYNYIYFNVAGFSENDTFRSNQIREGMIDRETALLKSIEENKPRYETIKWYLEIVGLDYENVIKRINKIPKLYKLDR